MMMRICRVIDTLGRDTDRVERRERKKWGRRKPDTREDIKVVKKSKKRKRWVLVEYS